MNRYIVQVLLVIAGALLFNALFWQEKMALNALLFDGFILVSVFFLYPQSLKKPVVYWLLAGHLLTGVALLTHNSGLSKLAFVSTLLLLVIFVQYLHRSAWYAAGTAIIAMAMAVPQLVQRMVALRWRGSTGLGLRRSIRFIILPLLIAAVFVVVYATANAVFSELLIDIGNAVAVWFTNLFDWFSWSRLGFTFVGLFICAVLLLKAAQNYFESKEALQQNELQRKRRSLAKWHKTGLYDMLYLFMGRFAGGTLALRNENTVGIISLALLNGLLLCINCIDIVYVWFGFNYRSDINLSAYVHEGAGLLIFSILLAMLVLLFFFRGNLNFYTQNRWLRYGAYLWIVQNCILVVSVFIRDWYYFVHMGLAYKRIGVVVFLLLVLAGLITLFIKIHYRKSNYYLLRINAWCGVVMLVATSCVSWDEVIANHNLSRKGTIPVDVNYLLSLDDATLPIIEKNKDVLDTAFLSKMKEVNYMYRSNMKPVEFFELRKRWFFEEQEGYSWLSWNGADARVRKELARPVIKSLSQLADSKVK